MTIRILAGPTVPAIIAIARTLVAWVTLAAAVFLAAVAVVGCGAIGGIPTIADLQPAA